MGRAFPLSFFLCSLTFLHVAPAEGQANPSKSAVQDTASSEVSQITTSTQSEGIVHLDVDVKDGAGKFVPGLTAKDFTLLDEGVPRTLVSFRGPGDETRENSGRLCEAILVLDRMDLSASQFAAARDETIKFLRQNGGHLPLPVSIYSLTGGGLRSTASPTTDGNALAEAVAHGRFPREIKDSPLLLQTTALPTITPTGLTENDGTRWDNTVKTTYLSAIERRDSPGRKVLVWIGYGWPNAGIRQSREATLIALSELSTRMREARITVCQIPIWPDPKDPGFDPSRYLAGVRSTAELKKSADLTPLFALPVLAIQSGGLIVSSSQNIVQDIGTCIQESDSFYSLSFNPPHAAHVDEYHEIKVQIGRPGITASTNTGYYNEPVFYDQPRVPARRVTVQELEQMLDAAAKENDGELMKRLRNLELTERLSSGTLSLWLNRLHGKKSKAALTVLADGSVFLDPPASAIISEAPPDRASQDEMMQKTEKYLDDTIPQLPGFSAMRTTVEYEQISAKEKDVWNAALADQSLYEGVTEQTILRNLNGHEEQDKEKIKGDINARGKSLNFIGLFGPILRSVLVDAMRSDSELKWVRWEQGAHGRVAVYQYVVRGKNPGYIVTACCLRYRKVFRTLAEYHGELTIDPDTGVILRLTMGSEPGWIVEQNPRPVEPIMDTGMMVEYGPVNIGGRTFICPQRSVVMMRSRTIRSVWYWGQMFEIYGPYSTQLNDVAYTHYRKFGSESRLLPGFEVVPDAGPGGAGVTPPQP
ncbi:MAG TPA: VWA domain-containing protein [Acidobacteriaceae bacterium]|jgi:VWFA-related protein|nr:VWA domain-containing protein [Acidobacteriaceae bacterium]